MDSSPARRKYVVFTVAALISLVLDQATKAWATVQLQPLGSAGMSIYKRNVVFLYAQNPGVAFSRLQGLPGGRALLSLMALAAIGIVLLYLRKTPAGQRMMHAGLGLIFGGALGNLIDRVRLGKVTDFVLVDTGFWPFNPWPVFNVADVVLVVGVGLIALNLRGGAGGSPPATSA